MTSLQFLRRPLLWALLATVIAVVLLYGGVSWFLASQVTASERKPLEARPEEYGLSYDEVSFTPRDGDITLKGWRIPSGGSTPAIIMTHGLDGTRADTDIPMLEVARDLTRRGFTLLMYDIRGHGESGGDRFNGGYVERMDALGAFDYLVGSGAAPDEIGLLGFSLGAGITLMAAGDEPRIRAVVADSAFASTEDLIVSEVERRTSLPAWTVPALIPGMKLAGIVFFGIDVGDIRPIDGAASLDYPALLIHGTGDTRIPPSHSKRIRETASHPGTELWLVDGAEHVEAYRTRPEKYIDVVAGYFQHRLGSTTVDR